MESTYPILKSEVWNRKAGRYDFDRFDNVISTSARAGYRSFGEASVDCRFHFKESRFGVLGDNENAAGIIYMEITFHQPAEHKLAWARVQLTLDEDDPRLKVYKKKRTPAGGGGGGEIPVSITDYYGPVHLVGALKKKQVEKTWELNPSLDSGGFGGGSLGSIGKKEQFQHESRRTFHSYKVDEKDRRKRKIGDRVLRWEVTENNVDHDPAQPNQIFTAFAYEHSGQPFLMKVEIRGRFEKWGDRVKEKLKFGPRHGNDVDISTTFIGEYRGRRWPLDERAKGLSTEMKRRNYEWSSSQEVTGVGPQAPAPPSPPPPPPPPVPPGDLSGAAEEQAEFQQQHQQAQPEDQGLIEEMLDPLLEELASAASYPDAPVRRPSSPTENSEHSSSSTLVGEELSPDSESIVKANQDIIEKTARITDKTIRKYMAWTWSYLLISLLYLLSSGWVDIRKYYGGKRDAETWSITEKL